MRKTLSIVVPAKNEAANLPALMARLTETMLDVGVSYEVVVIDDGSTDDTLAVLAKLHAEDNRICAVSLSRNFGKEVAIAAGLRYARGQAVVLMDADLQHPPEFIAKFVELWQSGYQVVYAQRASREGETALKRWSARLFYKIFAKIGEVRLPEGIGDFILLDAKVVDALNHLEERNRFSKGLYAWAGYRQIAVPYHPADRFAGQSNFNFWRLWLFALTGFLSFTTAPLRVWSYVGLLVSLGALIYGIYLIVSTLLFGVETPGYASLMVALLFFSGVQLLSLGIIGEYISGIFGEVKRRPLFLVADTIGLPGGEVRQLRPDPKVHSPSEATISM